VKLRRSIKPIGHWPQWAVHVDRHKGRIADIRCGND
jgi:hypothetical protein